MSRIIPFLFLLGVAAGALQRSPEKGVDGFQEAFRAGNREEALSFSTRRVIFEEGEAEMGRDEYAAKHLAADLISRNRLDASDRGIYKFPRRRDAPCFIPHVSSRSHLHSGGARALAAGMRGAPAQSKKRVNRNGKPSIGRSKRRGKSVRRHVGTDAGPKRRKAGEIPEISQGVSPHANETSPPAIDRRQERLTARQ